MSYLTAIILAAGSSTRMDSVNKLLLPFGDASILERVVETVNEAHLDEVVVVTGYEDRRIRDVLSRYKVRVAYNPEFSSGISSSIRRGLLAASPQTDGYLICQGNMPLIMSSTIVGLCNAFTKQQDRRILVAAMNGKRGQPFLFPVEYRDALMGLRGDQGMQHILEEKADAILEVEVADKGIFLDIDTRETYDNLGTA